MNTLYLDRKHLNKHVFIGGDNGTGKSLFLFEYLRNVERAGEIAVIWDPEREFARKFRDVGRGDIILDPTCEECPYWDMRMEYDDEGQAHALSTCFFPDNPSVKDPFWNNSARGLFTLLNTLHRPTTAEIGLWCADDSLIDERVAGTEYERILTNNAPGMRSSIISHLNQIAQPLRMMPTHPEGRKTFAMKEWCKKRPGWLFITSSPEYSEILNPLHSFFLSSLIQNLISMGYREDLPPVHIIFEEAATVNVQAMHTGMIRLRKTGCPMVIAIQSYSDLEEKQGANRAQTMFSQAYYKVFFRLSAPKSVELARDTIGRRTIKKMRENFQAPALGIGRYQRSFSVTEEEDHVVKDHAIQNMPDREGYIIAPGKYCHFELPIVFMRDRGPEIRRRLIPPMVRRLPQEFTVPQPPSMQDLYPTRPLLGSGAF